jgi:hypothetical protein
MAIRLANANNAIIKRSPEGSKKLFYFATPSSAPGVVPEHLKGNANRFAAAAPKCSAEVRGAAKGDRLKKFRGCMSRELGGKRGA